MRASSLAEGASVSKLFGSVVFVERNRAWRRAGSALGLFAAGAAAAGGVPRGKPYLHLAAAALILYGAGSLAARYRGRSAGVYRISAARRAFIESNFVEWSFNRPEHFLPDKARFMELNHPAELHYLADVYNWDDDTMVLGWILESPLCARATANLLFWRAWPRDFEESDLNDETTCPPFCHDGFRLVKMVLERYRRNDFSPVQIAFDPRPEMEMLCNRNRNWRVPLGVYDIIDGLAVEG